MLKIAVFGFYGAGERRSPLNTRDFMRAVWEMEPPASRIGNAADSLGFVKLTTVTRQPIYAQALSDEMATGAGLLACDGYIVILDAVKLLGPDAIRHGLRRLYDLQPRADVIIAAGRQNEPDALSCEDIRAILGLNPDLLIMPYVPDQPKTVHRLVRRLVRYIDDPDRVPPPIFVGDTPPAPRRAAGEVEDPAGFEGEVAARPTPRIHGLDHVAIIVSDLARALDFYRGLLGFRLLGHVDTGDARGRTLTHLDTGRGTLELVSYANAPALSGDPFDVTRTGIPHLALRVTDLDAIARTLSEAGVPFSVRPIASPHGVRVAFCADPDGTLIELIEGNLIWSRR